MKEKEHEKEKEFSIDDRLDQIIDMKKSENSAMKKIYESLRKTKEKNSNK
jgi:hypothetical protein